MESSCFLALQRMKVKLKLFFRLGKQMTPKKECRFGLYVESSSCQVHIIEYLSQLPKSHVTGLCFLPKPAM